MRQKSVLVFAILIFSLSLIATPVSAGDDGKLRFKKTVRFVMDEMIKLDAEVGPVDVDDVEFTKGGESSSVAGKVFGKIRGSGTDSEVTTTIVASFECENPKSEEWEVTFSLEFLDKNGKLIDKVSRSRDFEGEAKIYELSHGTLSYVVPHIHKVKITLEAELD